MARKKQDGKKARPKIADLGPRKETKAGLTGSIPTQLGQFTGSIPTQLGQLTGNIPTQLGN